MSSEIKDTIFALPTFNEVASIEIMVNLFRNHNLPFFVVDANSTDGTIKKAVELNIEIYQRNEYGNGYGCAILKAMDIAECKGYKNLGFIDCDTTYPLESFAKMFPYLENHSMIIGARNFNEIDPIRRLGNKVHTWIASVLFNTKIRDINSGMRIIKLSSFKGHVSAKNMGMVAQMTCFAIRNKIPFKELNIEYGQRIGESKLKLRDGFTILFFILKERFRKPLIG